MVAPVVPAVVFFGVNELPRSSRKSFTGRFGVVGVSSTTSAGGGGGVSLKEVSSVFFSVTVGPVPVVVDSTLFGAKLVVLRLSD